MNHAAMDSEEFDILLRLESAYRKLESLEDDVEALEEDKVYYRAALQMILDGSDPKSTADLALKGWLEVKV